MPTLPSGLNLAISRDALFDHGGNWFKCPEGHFWYWEPDPEIGPAPFDPDTEITLIAKHALVPKDREEAKQFVRVLEMRPDGKYGWRGELLHSFPKFAHLDDRDTDAWESWIKRPETDRFLDDTIEKCKKLAKSSENARGYAVVEGVGDQTPDSKGYIKGNLRTSEGASHEIEMKESTIEQMIDLTKQPKRMPTISFGKHRGSAWPDVPIDYLNWMVGQADIAPDAIWNAQQEL